MKTFNLLDYVSPLFPYQRKSNIDWILPAAVGIGVGIAAGIGVGFLLAPAPGAETRRQLRDSANRVGEKARLLTRRAQHELNDMGHDSTKSFLNDVGDIR